jgi:hypothetical protein
MFNSHTKTCFSVTDGGDYSLPMGIELTSIQPTIVDLLLVVNSAQEVCLSFINVSTKKLALKHSIFYGDDEEANYLAQSEEPRLASHKDANNIGGPCNT